MRFQFQAVIPFFFTALIFLSGCSSDDSTVAPPPAFQVLQTKDYNGAQVASFTLPNGMRALLISSDKTTDAKIAVSVGVGSHSNPPEHPGLAHFVEHMLFLGTDQFPNPSEYMDFVKSVSGQHNAFTASDETTYFLNVPSFAFIEGVRRLSRFFVAPTFDESYVTKEKGAIENEYSRRLDSDQQSRAMGGFFPANAVQRKFSVGNAESLAKATADDARAFFEKYYSSRRMSVVLMAPEPIEKLRLLALQNFSDIPDRGLTETAKPSPMDDSQLNQLMRVQNPELSNSLSFTALSDLYETNFAARRILGAVLGDESEGSLLAVLQARGLALPQKGALTAGAYVNGVNIRVRLTPEGVERYQDVIALIKGYISFVKQAPFPDYMVTQMNSLNIAANLETDYSVLDVNAVAGLAGRLLVEPNWTNLFENPTTPEVTEAEYRAAVNALKVESFYGNLIDSRSRVSLSSLGLTGHVFPDTTRLDDVTVGGKKYLIDGYYNGAYEYVKLDLTKIAEQTDASFSIPKMNPYIPTTFTILPQELSDAEKLAVGTNAEVNLNPGAGVKLPKAFFTGVFFATDFDKNDKAEMSRLIFMKNWLLASIVEAVYPFQEAGLAANLAVLPSAGGMQLSFDGWSDNFERAITDYISLIRFSENEIAFQKFKQIQLISLNQFLQSPDRLVQEAYNEKYLPTYPKTQDQIDAVQAITLQETKELYNRFFKETYFQGVLSGNVKPSMATEIIKALGRKWPQTKPLDKSSLANMKLVEYGTVTDKTVVEINIDGNYNAYVSEFYQFGAHSKKERIMALMIGRWIGGDFYNELRTQQQVAYSLGAGGAYKGQYYGLTFYVESGTHGSIDVAQRVQAFIQKWVTETLPKKPQSQVDAYISLVKASEQGSGVLDHQGAVGQFIFPPTLLTDEPGTYEITIEEVVEFARLKLIESPEGLFIKVKSVKDPVAAPRLARGA